MSHFNNKKDSKPTGTRDTAHHDDDDDAESATAAEQVLPYAAQRANLLRYASEQEEKHASARSGGSLASSAALSGTQKSAIKAIRTIYEKHNSSKLDELPALLSKYLGKESDMLSRLRIKYQTSGSLTASLFIGTSELWEVTSTSLRLVYKGFFWEGRPAGAGVVFKHDAEGNLQGDIRGEASRLPLSATYTHILKIDGKTLWTDESETIYVDQDGCVMNVKEFVTDVQIAEGVTTIRERAFRGCSSISSITLPEGLTTIENEAFEGCRSLRSINFPKGLTTIGENAFDGCMISSVTLPEGLTTIGDSAFSGCSLSSISLPEGLTTIGGCTFSNCTSLRSIIFPECLTTIKGYAFNGCTSLSSIALPEGLTCIGNSAFSGCRRLSSITISEGLTTIGGYAFFECTSLSSVTLPAGLTTIGESVFFGCRSLSSITFPDGLATIGVQAFCGCTILEQRSVAAGHQSVESYLRFISSRANRRYTVITSLTRLRAELYARQAKRTRRAGADEAVDNEEEQVEVEQAGVLRGALAFEMIHSDDLWRHILEFV